MAENSSVGTPQISAPSVSGNDLPALVQSVQTALDGIARSTQFWLQRAFDNLNVQARQLQTNGIVTAPSTNKVGTVLTGASSQYPDGRILTGGVGITVDDHGPGDVVMVDVAPGSTYTPTVTLVLNAAAATPYVANYVRVGTNMVIVSGRIDVDPTGAGSVRIGMSLPIPSNFTDDRCLGGVAHAIAIAGFGAGVEADPTNDRAQFEWVAVDTTNQPLWFIFMYRIL